MILSKADYLAKVAENIVTSEWSEEVQRVLWSKKFKEEYEGSMDEYAHSFLLDFLEDQLYNTEEIDSDTIDYDDDTGQNEWVDGQIDISHYKLYESVKVFSDYIDEALEEQGTTDNLVKIIQVGQYRFWEQYLREGIDLLKEKETDIFGEEEVVE